VPSIEGLKLKDPKDFRYLGKGEIGIVDLHDITTGAARYGADVRLPGMKYAVIARPPVTGGKVASFDGSEAMKVSGVEKVLEVKGWPWPSKFQPLGGVAVIARNTGAAIKGRDALKITWDDGANAKYDSVAYRAELEEAARKPGLVVRKEGDVEAALKGADKVIVGEYYLLHLAHVAMEPPVAVADVKGNKAEIWAPVQSAGGTSEDVAKTLDIPQENVTVNVTLLGGGFGRKSKCDFALEAALLSKELGAPVKVQWTREDDIRNGFLHTVSVERIEAGLDKSGKADGLAAPQRRAQHRLELCCPNGAPGAVRTRHGTGRHALRGRQCAMRKPGSGRAHPHWLVPLGLEHPARLRGAVRRNRPSDQARPEGHAAGADRRAADPQPHLGEGFVELWRAP
jgi:isoquinoline 1-oxidoreductase beta subunit